MTFRTEANDDDLLIRSSRGESDTLVLAFTGIGHRLGAIQTEEFVGAATDGGANSAMFISDRRRSWYSRTGLVDRVSTLVRAFTHRCGATRLVSLGNSMGGYGAILFTASLPVETSVAIVPQFSMDQGVIPERRWKRFRKEFGPALPPSLAGSLRARTQYNIVYGADSAKDGLHAAGFRPAPNLHKYMVPGAGHDAAKQLKRHGTLSPLMRALIGNDRSRAEDLMQTYRRDVQAPTGDANWGE